MFRPHIMLLLSLITAMAAGGASCPRRRAPAPPVPVFASYPSLNQIAQVINANSSLVSSLQATGATLNVEGAPALRADLALQRPRRFRLRVELGLTGAEMDIGSNEDHFWLWVKRNQPPAVYHCKHDQFATSAARQVLPVPPEWLGEALGVVSLDLAAQHSGPVPIGAGRLEVRSLIPSPGGDIQRILVVHDTFGWILEQHLLDAQGQTVASAISSGHHENPETGVILPRHVDVRLPTVGLAFSIDVPEFQVNQIGPQAQGLWTMPRPPGFPLVDLATTPPSAIPAAQLRSLPPPPPPRYPLSPTAARPQRTRGFGFRN